MFWFGCGLAACIIQRIVFGKDIIKNHILLMCWGPIAFTGVFFCRIFSIAGLLIRLWNKIKDIEI